MTDHAHSWSRSTRRYHLSLHVSYPNAADRARAMDAGRSPGGAIFVHGQPNRLPENRRMLRDWTDGCIAVTWRLADGVLFSVLSSLVLWSALLTSVYKALG